MKEDIKINIWNEIMKQKEQRQSLELIFLPSSVLIPFSCFAFRHNDDDSTLTMTDMRKLVV